MKSRIRRRPNNGVQPHAKPFFSTEHHKGLFTRTLGATLPSLQLAPARGGKKAKNAAIIASIRALGIASVVGPFKPRELPIVKNAISLLNAKEKTAIQGAKIERVAKPLIVPGHAAHYQIRQSITSGGLVKDEHKIVIYDDVFFERTPSGKTLKSSKESTRVIVHEVGHAIAKQTHRKATRERMGAESRLIKTIKTQKELATAQKALKTARDGVVDIQEVMRLIKLIKSMPSSRKLKQDKKKQERDVKRKKAIEKKTSPQAHFRKSHAKKKFKQMKAGSGVAKRSLRLIRQDKKKLPGKSHYIAYIHSLITTENTITKFYKENVLKSSTNQQANTAKNQTDRSVKKRNNHRSNLYASTMHNLRTRKVKRLLKRLGKIEEVQDACYNTSVWVVFQTKMPLPVKKFVSFVNQQGIST